MKFAVVGAGLSGAIIANKLAKKGFQVDVYEKRNHIGGNCYTERDTKTNIIEHKYGPHIFHTSDEVVWGFICDYLEMIPYVNRVKTTVNNSVYSLPINLHTINQFFNKTFNPNDAKEYIESVSENISKPKNFEEQALSFVGKDIYEAFFKGYTKKQWGVDPKELPESILKRLPLRFNYDDNYFNHKYQGMPKNGYTELFEKLLNLENINLKLQSKFKNENNYDHVFYSGPIDEWFNYKHGRLGYRTLEFIKERHEGDYQGCAVMNYGDEDVKFTRITEHKYFSPWEKHDNTIIYKEYSKLCTDKLEPYYPIRLTNDKIKLEKYAKEVKSSKKVTFVGRLATYKYIDMDVTIRQALDLSDKIILAIDNKEQIPSLNEDLI